ncbi:hypothetical protein [Streptomyces sp. NPDC090080]|uniref:hypothetical protein n=1 Tax=Streptomyces sp. NPDC090080 TaxID=3365939 RepID=UPI003828F604
MSTRSRPLLKSITTTPDGPQAAHPRELPAAGGEPKGAARKGVRTSSNPRAGTFPDPTPERPGIRIYAPPVYRHPYDGARWSKRYADTPNAACACPCGLTATATGAADVAALICDYEYHRAKECTGAAASPTEGRAAA